MEKLAKKMELKMEQFLLTRLIRFNINKEMQLTFRKKSENFVKILSAAKEKFFRPLSLSVGG